MRELEFPQKDKHTTSIILTPEGTVVETFDKCGEIPASIVTLLGCARNLGSVLGAVKAKGYRYKEEVRNTYGELFGAYTGAEEEAWWGFETDIKKAYLEGVDVEAQENFYQRCWGYAKAHDEGMEGIETLFDMFAEYLQRGKDEETAIG